jgi:hypothetical protein
MAFALLPPTGGCRASDYQLVHAWSAGDYEVEVSYALEGDIAFVCTLSLADADLDDDGGGSGNQQGSCTQTQGDGSAVLLNVLNGGTTVLLSLYDAPEAFDLVLRRDGETLFEDTVTPDYETSHLAGRSECGACRQADMSIELE